jgi:hypothetical protein
MTSTCPPITFADDYERQAWQLQQKFQHAVDAVREAGMACIDWDQSMDYSTDATAEPLLAVCDELLANGLRESGLVRCTFGEWLLEYAGSGPVEDLRDDFKIDCESDGVSPAAIRRPSTMRDHMTAKGASDEALCALGVAAKLYWQQCFRMPVVPELQGVSA